MTGPTEIDPGQSRSTTAPTDAGENRRRLAMVWVGALGFLGALVVVVAILRILAEVGGYIITHGEERRLQLAAAYHAALAIGGAVAYHSIRSRPKIGVVWLRALACMTPFLLLASADRIAAYFIPPNYHKNTIWLLDDELGWRLRPNSSDPVQFADINNKGIRGPDVSYEKPADEFRILFLGDSVTFGVHVPYEDTFSARLQRGFSQRNMNKKIVVINTAVSGYSPWQELIVLQREGLAYEPDLVVQGFCLNDVTQKFSLSRFGGNTTGEAVYATAYLEWSGLFRLLRKLPLWLHYGSDTVEGARQETEIWLYSLFDPDEKQKARHAWEVTNENMSRLFETCRTAKIPMAVVFFPMSNQLEPAPQAIRPQVTLERLCAEHEVSFYDMLSDMREWYAAHPEAEGLMLDDVHFNKEGHRFVADRIAEFLVNHKLVPTTR